MAETRVALPEPGPEDDEDVVWGISTAKALWARGERADALVWLRRAAEAAEAAGHSFRSSEIGLYISELEDAVAAGVPEGRAPMHASPEIDTPAPAVVHGGGDHDAADTIADATAVATRLEVRRRIDDDEQTLVRRNPHTSQPPPQPTYAAHAPAQHSQVLPPPPQANAGPAAAPPMAYGPPPGHAPAGRGTHPLLPAVHATSSAPPTHPGFPGGSTQSPNVPAMPHGSAQMHPPPMSAVPMHAPGPPAPQMHPMQGPPSGPPLRGVQSARPMHGAPMGQSAPPMQADARVAQSAPSLRTSPPHTPAAASSRVVTSYSAEPVPAPPPTRSSAPAPPVPVGIPHAAATAAPAFSPPPHPSSPPMPPMPGSPPVSAPPGATAHGALAAVVPTPPSSPSAPPTPQVAAASAASASAPAADVDSEGTAQGGSAALEPDSEPPMAIRTARQPAAAASASATSPPADPRKKRRRAPILDPWSEPEAPRSSFLTRREARAEAARASDPKLPEVRGADGRAEAAGPRPEPADVELREDAVVVSVRSRPLTLPEEEDDEVVTSAVPLDALRRRSARVPPPPPPAAPRPRPAGDPAADVIGDALPPPPPPQGLSAPPPPAKPPTPPPPPPLVGAPQAGQFGQTDPASARARLAPDAEPVPSKTPGAGPPPKGPQLPIAQRTVGGLPLDRAGALGELPHQAQALLAAQARVERLGPDEEVSGFAVALVVDGDAFVCATIVDAPAHRLQAGALVPARGNLGDAGVAVRVVAGASGARVAVWDATAFETMLRSEPAIASELRDRADRLQALAGTTLGPLGEIDETYRNLAVERLTVKLARPGEVLAAKGTPMRGLAIVAAGSVEVEDDGQVRELGPGELLFPDAVLRALPAPANVRASQTGALLLVGERRLAEELMVTVPPLVEILGA